MAPLCQLKPLTADLHETQRKITSCYDNIALCLQCKLVAVPSGRTVVEKKQNTAAAAKAFC